MIGEDPMPSSVVGWFQAVVDTGTSLVAVNMAVAACTAVVAALVSMVVVGHRASTRPSRQ